MIMVALSGLLFGAVLGTRFKVQVIYPAATLGLVVLVSVAVFKGSAISSALLAAIVYVISLQIGYLGGLFTRFCMVAARVVLHRSLRSSTARS
jgi:hypothetical protein